MSGAAAGAKRAALYARVSTADQEPGNQVDELREYAARRGWVVHDVYVDRGVSGAKDRRPQLDALLEDARRRRIDVVLVWALDRLGRSLPHLVRTAEQLEAWGVDLVALTQPIDTTSPAGRLTFAVLGAVAQFERELLRERVAAGLRRARREGKRIGRPPVRVDVDRARELLAGGASVSATARALSVSRRGLRRALARAADGGADDGDAGNGTAGDAGAAAAAHA